MKKFILPVLAVLVVFGLGFLGYWLYWQRNQRVGVKLGTKLKVQNAKLKTEEGSIGKFDKQVGEYLLTPGPAKSIRNGKEVVTSVNGRFVRLEEIKGLKDRYLILDTSEGQVSGNRLDGPYSKLRVVFTPKPDKGIKNATQLSVIRTSGVAGKSISSRLKEVGYFGKLTDEQVNFFLRPGVWLKAILYRTPEGLIMDDNGHYYVLAISVSETL